MFYGEKNGPKVVFDHVWSHHNTDIVTEKSNHSFLSWHQNEKNIIIIHSMQSLSADITELISAHLYLDEHITALLSI